MTNITFTKHELQVLNGSYHMQHTLTDSDVLKVNETIKVIENSRSKEIPQAGDRVRYTNQYGDYYGKAHIEKSEKDSFYICEVPMTPFVEADGGELYCSIVSGGAKHHIPKNLRYVGTEKKTFSVWGHSGACGNGAVDFQAEVSVWEYTEGEHEFTTKTHDKLYVTIREKREQKSDYKYIIRGGASHTAFHTDEEYQAWLKTFHGVEIDGAWDNVKIVWVFKEESKCIPLEQYLKLEGAIVDSELCNGHIQECKRIIEGTTIKTYLPYQNDMIVLEGEKCYKNAYMK